MEFGVSRVVAMVGVVVEVDADIGRMIPCGNKIDSRSLRQGVKLDLPVMMLKGAVP